MLNEHECSMMLFFYEIFSLGSPDQSLITRYQLNAFNNIIIINLDSAY